MAPRSIASGHLRIQAAFEGSKAEQFYAVCLDADNLRRADGRYTLSCDCPAWVSNQSARSGGPERICKHTEATNRLLHGHTFPNARRPAGDSVQLRNVIAMQPLLQPIEDATWRLQDVEATVDGLGASGSSSSYRMVLLNVTTVDGAAASACVALNTAHHHTVQRTTAAVAAYGGWAIAAEIARLSGFGTVGPPPPRYTFRQGTPTRRGAAQTPTTAVRRIGLHDLLQLGTATDLGDGLQPAQRAEHTLQLFLGQQYTLLQQNHFLDIPSRHFPGRVYRLRIDPQRLSDRRIRVYEHNCYINDFCVIRTDWQMPTADHFLGCFMRLLTNEHSVLAVVQRHNIFPPYSDSQDRDPFPALSPRTS